MGAVLLRSLPGQFLCQDARRVSSLRNVVRDKGERPRGSVEGRLRVNMAMLIGCQMSADWHARLRLTARIVTMSRGDGTVTKHSWAVWRLVEGGKRREKTAHASAPPVLTTAHASSTYVWIRAGMPTQRSVREARDTPGPRSP